MPKGRRIVLLFRSLRTLFGYSTHERLLRTAVSSVSINIYSINIIILHCTRIIYNDEEMQLSDTATSCLFIFVRLYIIYIYYIVIILYINNCILLFTQLQYVQFGERNILFGKLFEFAQRPVNWIAVTVKGTVPPWATASERERERTISCYFTRVYAEILKTNSIARALVCVCVCVCIPSVVYTVETIMTITAVAVTDKSFGRPRR